MEAEEGKYYYVAWSEKVNAVALQNIYVMQTHATGAAGIRECRVL